MGERRDTTPTVPRLVVADVFCGAGGLSAGFATARHGRSLGYSIAFGVDNDADCIATYRRNLLKGHNRDERGRRGPQTNVRNLDGGDILRAVDARRVDVLIGGPNCQAVSTAGVRNPRDERNDMFAEFVRLVEELRPRWFVLENVPGLTHRNNLPLLRRMFERLSRIKGYRVAADMLLASDYGVPQHRYRLFVIGTRTGRKILFPRPTHGKNGLACRTVRDAIGDLAHVPTDGRIVDHVRSELDTTTVRRIRSIPQGGDWRDMPIALLPQRNFQTRSSDQKGTYGRLAWDGPAFTITGLFPNVSAGPFAHPTQHRALTPREAARLQGFSDGFVFDGYPRSWARQIGNAVPPPLARAIAKEILDAEHGAKRTGVAPRLTLEVIRDAARGKRDLPVLTPRAGARPGFARTRGNGGVVSDDAPWKVSRADRRRLEVEAKMPAYTWTAKRAKALLLYVQRRSHAWIAKRLGLSESTIRRWTAGYRRQGFDGWRAYHTSVEAIARDDPKLRVRLRNAVERARHAHIASHSSEHRPHMNVYVRRLAQRFGSLSVRRLIARLAAERDIRVGTVYVADLLAIADVALSRPNREQKTAA